MTAIAARSEAHLVFDNVTLGYGGSPTPVLESFSLSVDLQSFVAVLGPSGCGKSTLLHAAAGFLKPFGGAITLKGVPISEPGLEVGLVSQQYWLFPWRTVERNIAFGLESKDLMPDQRDAIVDRLLNLTDLARKRNAFPAQLSGGMQQRVALARAMAVDPSLLLLDEPFSALDRETRSQMRELLLQLWSEHRSTMLFVTHDIEEALLLADTLVLLRKHHGIAHTMDVPLGRPRPPGLVHTSQFRDLYAQVVGVFASAGHVLVS